LKSFSQYELQDHLAIELARTYSQEHGEPFFAAIGKHAGYDLISGSGKIKLELKCDLVALRTGNVCLEYWNTSLSKASGVLATTATVWVHIVLEPGGLVSYEYDMDILRKLVIEEGRVKGNGLNSLCKIIPLDVFRRHARRSFPFRSRFLEDIMNQSAVRPAAEMDYIV